NFNRVHRLKVDLTGAGGKPLANAAVSLQDSAGTSSVALLDPTANGNLAFAHVALGAAKLTVTPKAGGAVTKEITVAAPISGGGTVIPVALPDVTDVVEAAPAPATPSPAAAPAAPGAPAAPAPPGTAPAATPGAAPGAAPAPASPAPPSTA